MNAMALSILFTYPRGPGKLGKLLCGRRRMPKRPDQQRRRLPHEIGAVEGTHEAAVDAEEARLQERASAGQTRSKE